jgi:hypothetical protein
MMGIDWFIFSSYMESLLKVDNSSTIGIGGYAVGCREQRTRRKVYMPQKINTTMTL